jgi:soluble cytochrome b562
LGRYVDSVTKLPLVVFTVSLFSLLLIPAHAKTELEATMKDMAGATHRVEADLKLTDDTKHARDADLKDVATMKADAVKAQTLTPKKEQMLPPDQQAAMTTAYQKDMTAFAADIDTLGTDIQADKWDAARTDFKKLIDDEKAGHKAYRIKKD